jgi:C1A family cysteine protease
LRFLHGRRILPFFVARTNIDISRAWRYRQALPKKISRKKSSPRSRIARRTNFSHGWVPDLPDHRDYFYTPPAKLLRALPSRVDLRADCPAVYNQGGLHSCTAHAIAAAIQFEKKRQAHPENLAPSRLFIYYNERTIERSIHSDSGAQIRSGIKSVAKRGVCPERLWPYRARKFRQKPWRKCYTEGAKHPALTYHRVRRRLPQLKACLASGYPVIFGFTVYESFHSKKVRHTGRAPMPKHEKVRGGHAVLAVGYDDAQRRFIVRNSWGSKWGKRGYFTLPYDYFTNRHLSQDFWTIRVVK